MRLGVTADVLWRSYPVNVDMNSMLWEMVAFILMISSFPSNINQCQEREAGHSWCKIAGLYIDLLD